MYLLKEEKPREKERYTHLNAEFKRISRRDKKAFLSDQCKEIEEKTEWESLEISSRKLEIPKEHFMQRWAQQRTEMVRTYQKQKLLRRGGKNTQMNYTKKIFKTQIIHDGVMHLEPDILECEVKWALECITMNKASGGDGIPVELFQILKDDAV